MAAHVMQLTTAVGHVAPCSYGELREVMLGGGTDGGELFCFVQFCRVQVGGLVLWLAGGALTRVRGREAA